MRLKINTIDVNIPELLEFLDERYNENKKELAYIFALGAINCMFYDRKKGIEDLLDFVGRAKDKKQYSSMSDYALELIEAERYRVRNIERKRKKRKKAKRKWG